MEYVFLPGSISTSQYWNWKLLRFQRNTLVLLRSTEIANEGTEVLLRSTDVSTECNEVPLISTDVLLRSSTIVIGGLAATEKHWGYYKSNWGTTGRYWVLLLMVFMLYCSNFAIKPIIYFTQIGEISKEVKGIQRVKNVRFCFAINHDLWKSIQNKSLKSAFVFQILCSCSVNYKCFLKLKSGITQIM